MADIHFGNKNAHSRPRGGVQPRAERLVVVLGVTQKF